MRAFIFLSSLLMFTISGTSLAGISDWDIPESSWRENQRRSAFDALSDRKGNILIVPFRCADHCFGHIELLLITRLVSDQIRNSTGVSVLPPTYVLRALGEHLPPFEEAPILRLAKHTGAKTILRGEVTRDPNGKFSIRFDVLDATDGTLVRTRQWSDLPYTDTRPPSAEILSSLAEIAEFATSVPSKRRKPEFVKLHEVPQIPRSLDELMTESGKSTLHAAIYLQYLAALHPREPYNEARNRLLERSIVALGRLARTSSEYDFLLARAYAQLDRRPAALAALGEAKTSHGRALVAALNGNLDQLRAEVANIEWPLFRFLAMKDLLLIEARYDKEKTRDCLDEFLDEGSDWLAFTFRALHDEETWANFSALTTKIGLEALLPNDTPTAEASALQRAAMGLNFSEFEMSKLVLQHIDRLRSANELHWVTAAVDDAKPFESDVIDIASITLITNVIRKVQVDLYRRKTPDRALRRIQEFDLIFAGHPELTLHKGLALRDLASDSKGAEKRSLTARSDESYRNGFVWTGEITPEAAYVGRNMGRYFPTKEEYKIWLESGKYNLRTPTYRRNEWPLRVESHRFAYSTNEDDLKECIEYTWTKIDCLRWLVDLISKSPDATRKGRSSVLSDYSNRFVGHPKQFSLELTGIRLYGNATDREKLFRSYIDRGTTEWDPYLLLGRLLVRRGQYDDARDHYLSYPGFDGSQYMENIGIANNAGIAASDLYWTGAYEQAIPLMEVSVAAGSGSFLYYSSLIRLALVDGNIESATQYATERARRYQSNYDIRDLMTLLHIQDQSLLAWSIFDQFLPKMKDPQLWTGALVGHRKEGATTSDIQHWLEESETRLNKYWTKSYPRYIVGLAPRYLLVSGTLDRRPGPELAQAIRDVQTLPQPIYYSKGHVSANRMRLRQDPLVPAHSEHAIAAEDSEIQTRFEFLAQGMTAFLNGDYAASFEIFNETAYYYSLSEYLPYFAFSAGILGRHSHLHAALDAREPELELIVKMETANIDKRGHRFNEDLTRAVLAAFDNKPNEAMDNLRRAINDRPYTVERSIYTFYEVVDIADRLYDTTKFRAYRDLALDLARKHTTIQPMYAWAYFVVAKFSESPSERISALASGLYLDPLSHRGSLLSDELRANAMKYLEINGPPYLSLVEEQDVSDT